MPSNAWLITHVYDFAYFKKIPAWGVPSVGKRGGKWEGLMRIWGVAQAYFTRQRNLWKPKPGFACGMRLTDRKTWCHSNTHTHPHTIFYLVAVAPQSHDLPPERITHCCPVPHMPLYGHSRDKGWYYQLQTETGTVRASNKWNKAKDR